jgi:hypothetical protein
MPNVRGGDQTRQGGYHTDTQIKKSTKPAYARNEISEAFAGEENRGPIDHKKSTGQHDTALKSRKLMRSSSKTPIKS